LAVDEVDPIDEILEAQDIVEETAAEEESSLQPYNLNIKVKSFLHQFSEEEEAAVLIPGASPGNLLVSRKDVQEFEPDDPKECPN
jgi:hypothetical protein